MAYFEGIEMTGGYGNGPDIISSCSVNVNKGEIVSILGPNGAGKSTAMKAMLGLLNLKSGSVKIDGKDISKLSPQDRVKQGISFVPQTKNVFSGMTVEENLEMGAFLINEEIKNIIEEIYELFPILREKKNQMVGWIEIECLWDKKKSELNTHKICMNYEDSGTYGCRNWKEVDKSKRMKSDNTPMETWEGGVYKDVDTTHEEQWNQVRDYFQTYLISFEERKKNKVPTPRLDKIRYYLNYCSQYEYDLIMMEMLYGKDISFTTDDGTEYPNREKKWFTDIFENFENQFKEDYPKENGWFESPTEMLTTYMKEKGVHEMEYWLEDKQEEIQKEMEEV